MPQTTIFFVEQDESPFLEFLFSEGFTFVPDLRYDKPAPSECTSILQVREFVPGSFYLTHPDYTSFPLLMSEYQRGKFTIKQREGGPVLDVSFRRPSVDNGKRLLGPGWIQYYASYWTPGLRERMYTPAPLVRAYRRVVSYVKRNSVPTVAKGFWVGKRAAEEVRAGTLTVHDAVGRLIALADTEAVCR